MISAWKFSDRDVAQLIFVNRAVDRKRAASLGLLVVDHAADGKVAAAVIGQVGDVARDLAGVVPEKQRDLAAGPSMAA